MINIKDLYIVLYFKMKFCSKCHNMYYISISETDENQLKYYCRNCGNVDEMITPDNICVLETSFKKSNNFNNIVNKFTKYDPTLPHITTIKCPNTDCKSNEDDSLRDVIYIRYDDVQMKYLYICSVCDTTWKTDEQH